MNAERKILEGAQSVATAIRLVATAFEHVFDKGGQPYVLHVLRVHHRVLSEDWDTQCCAILHDYVEDVYEHDHEAGYQRLRDEGFNERVIQLVRNVTKEPGETEAQTLAKVCKDRQSAKCKIADIKDNSNLTRLKGVREKDLDRMAKYVRLYHAISGFLKGEQHAA